MEDHRVFRVLDQDAKVWNITDISSIQVNDIFTIDDIADTWYRATSKCFFEPGLGYFGISADQIVQESLLAALIPGYQIKAPIMQTVIDTVDADGTVTGAHSEPIVEISSEQSSVAETPEISVVVAQEASVQV